MKLEDHTMKLVNAAQAALADATGGRAIVTGNAAGQLIIHAPIYKDLRAVLVYRVEGACPWVAMLHRPERLPASLGIYRTAREAINAICLR